MFQDDLVLGRRRQFVLRVLSVRGRYPNINFRASDAMYVASESLIYTVVPAEPPNPYGWSEIAWNDVGEIRLWGALALSIREGEGFYAFFPSQRGVKSIYTNGLRDEIADRTAKRLAGELAQPRHELHWVKPSAAEVEALCHALLKADAVLLRGVNCFLKSLAIWHAEETWMLAEELAMNLYISLEGGLSVIRQRLGKQAGRKVSYRDVFDFVRATFSHGDALAEYWEDAHDARNSLLHPDNDFSPYAIQPMYADDVWELFDPMLSLYRFLLLGELRPVSP